MKKFTYITMLIGIILIGVSHVTAQVVSGNISMIRSQDQLRNYAMSIAVSGQRSVWSEGIDWTDQRNMTWTEAKGSNGEEVLERLFATQLTYGILNSNDTARSYSYLFDTNGNILFFGYGEYQIGTEGMVNIGMQEIPLPLSGVDRAEIVALGEDGKTAYHYPVTVRNGVPYFSWWMAGSPNGVLITYMQDGSTVKYNLWDANPVGVEAGQDIARFEVQGHHIFRIGDTKGDNLIRVIETWMLPSVYLEMTKKDEVLIDVLGLYYDQNGSAFERPTSMNVSDENGITTVMPLVVNNWVGSVKLTMPAGKYRITFNWEKFGKPGNLYTGDSVPDGKG